jgi:hypothetical protein
LYRVARLLVCKQQNHICGSRIERFISSSALSNFSRGVWNKNTPVAGAPHSTLVGIGFWVTERRPTNDHQLEQPNNNETIGRSLMHSCKGLPSKDDNRSGDDDAKRLSRFCPSNNRKRIDKSKRPKMSGRTRDDDGKAEEKQNDF